MLQQELLFFFLGGVGVGGFLRVIGFGSFLGRKVVRKSISTTVIICKTNFKKKELTRASRRCMFKSVGSGEKERKKHVTILQNDARKWQEFEIFLMKA